MTKRRNDAVLMFTTATGQGNRFAQHLRECELHGSKCDRRTKYCRDVLKEPRKWGYR